MLFTCHLWILSMIAAVCHCHRLSIPIRTMSKKEMKKSLYEFRSSRGEMGEHRQQLPTLPTGSSNYDPELVYMTSFLTNVLYSSVSIGNPPQVFKVMFDTLTHPLWVPVSKTGSTSQCHAQFDENLSTSDALDGRNFTANLLESVVSGYFIKDFVEINNVRIPKQAIGMMTRITSPHYKYVAYDGVFGLNFFQDHDDPYSPLQNLEDLRIIDRRYIGFYVNTTQKDPITGEITFGYIDPRHNEDVKRHNVLYRGDFPEWRVGNASFQVGEKKICTKNEIFCHIMFATSAAKIYAPSKISYEFNTNLGARRKYYRFPVEKFIWEVPCALYKANKIPNIFATIGLLNYTIPTRHFITKIRIKGLQVCVTEIEANAKNYITFGMPFFKSYFVKFQMGMVRKYQYVAIGPYK